MYWSEEIAICHIAWHLWAQSPSFETYDITKAQITLLLSYLSELIQKGKNTAIPWGCQNELPQTWQFKTIEIYSHSSRGQTFKIKVWLELVPSRNSRRDSVCCLSQLLVAASTPGLWHHPSSLHLHPHVTVFSSLLYVSWEYLPLDLGLHGII